jgi:hypothetical protein
MNVHVATCRSLNTKDWYVADNLAKKTCVLCAVHVHNEGRPRQCLQLALWRAHHQWRTRWTRSRAYSLRGRRAARAGGKVQTLVATATAPQVRTPTHCVCLGQPGSIQRRLGISAQIVVVSGGTGAVCKSCMHPTLVEFCAETLSNMLFPC